MFSQLKRSPAELASSRTETDRRLAIVMGSDSRFDDRITERARELYGKLLPSGRARTSVRKTRIDSGRAGLQDKPESKQAWVRKRKEAVDRAASQESLHTPQRRPCRVELTDSMAKEVAKQDDLLKKRKAEAYLEGTLLEKEITPEVQAEAAQRLKMDGANDKVRAKKYTEVMEKIAFRQSPQTARWALEHLPSPAHILDDGGLNGAEVTRKLRAAGVTTSVQDILFLFGLIFFCE